MKIIQLALIVLICLTSIESLAKESFNKKEAYLYIFIKGINYPTSGNKVDTPYNCKKITLLSKEETYNNKLIREIKERKFLGAQYIEKLEETDSHFYIIQNVSKKYGDKYTYVEGILWTSTDSECKSLRTKIESLTEKSAIEYNSSFNKK